LFNRHSFIAAWERPILHTLITKYNAEINILELIGRQILIPDFL